MSGVGRNVLVTSLGRHNPTCIQHKSSLGAVTKESVLLQEGESQQVMYHSGLLFYQGKTRTFLAAGECAEAHVGDRILLLATNPDSYLEVAEMLPQNVAQQPQHSNKRFVHNKLSHMINMGSASWVCILHLQFASRQYID